MCLGTKSEPLAAAAEFTDKVSVTTRGSIKNNQNFLITEAVI